MGLAGYVRHPEVAASLLMHIAGADRPRYRKTREAATDVRENVAAGCGTKQNGGSYCWR